MNASEIRDLVPPLGLREYWYPALPERKVGRRKPTGRRMLGDDLVFFRGKDGDVVALSNVCAHRGGSLMHGDCHYRGTVACPYHGWVFDERGECVAVLSEGSDSKIPGKVHARVYPTRTLKGLVFVWMGQGAPGPIEEDVPPEFFEGPETLVFQSIRYWPVNWRVALENALDSHVTYVHRNAVLQLVEPILNFGPLGYRPRFVKDRAVIGYLLDDPTRRPSREFYPGVSGFWPTHRWRHLWTWAFRRRVSRNSTAPPFNAEEEWGMHTIIDGRRVRSGGHHLPSMFRFNMGAFMYTRCCVPVDENVTRVIYYHSVRRMSAAGRLWSTFHFHAFGNWLLNINFSTQDYRVMAPQRYDTPEKLSGTDAEVIAWRKLLLKARGMPSGVSELDLDDAE
jgi:nitrite reductase/ring-hydroxylating ferredoxin subunit